METVIILKNVAYAAKTGGGTIANLNELDLLVEGGCAIFDENGTLITTATTAASIENSANFVIATKINTGSTKTNNPVFNVVSIPIPRNAHQRSKSAFVAAAAKVISIGNDQVTVGASLNLGTVSPGNVYSFRVFRSEIGTDTPDGSGATQFGNGIDQMFIEVKAKTGDTEATITTKLVAAVNAHLNNKGAQAWVTAAALGGSGSEDGFTLTSNNPYVNISVGLVEGLTSADVIETTPLTLGSGNPAQVKYAEKLSRADQGLQSEIELKSQLFDVASMVDPGVTGYVTYDIHFRRSMAHGYTLNSGSTPHHVALYAPTGGAVVTSLDTILGLLTVSPVASPVTPGDTL